MRPNESPFIQQLAAEGEGAPSIEQKLELMQIARDQSPELAMELDRYLLEDSASLRADLKDIRQHQEKLKGVLEELTATPWHPAIFLDRVPTSLGDRAAVAHGNAVRIVGVAGEVGLDSLAAGDQVFLSNELNVIVAQSDHLIQTCGETAAFERRTPDGRLVIRSRDQELIVRAARALADTDLEPGDIVRWNQTCWMAFEKIERTEGKQYLLNEVPDTGPDRVGGQDENLDMLLSALTTILVDPKKARRYGLDGRNSILMVGPPGCGKTLMAQVVASETRRLSGKKCRFAVVKPGEWEDPYVGVTQKNIRNFFEALKQAAEDGFAIAFLDEIEAVGRIRGHAVGLHSDKFLDAFLVELDGFEDRKNIAIIAATNRKDLVDPALLDRLADVEVQVGRPNMDGAAEIFGIHLPASYPYSPNGSVAEKTRQDIIETGVSRLYSPNADNSVCVLRFRDGKARTVAARELASGRMFEQICRAARRFAFLRDVRGGESGIAVGDMERAVSDALDRMRSMLSIHNAHAYLPNLPQDVDVVAVEPVVSRVRRAHQYRQIQLTEQE